VGGGEEGVTIISTPEGWERIAGGFARRTKQGPAIHIIADITVMPDNTQRYTYTLAIDAGFNYVDTFCDTLEIAVSMADELAGTRFFEGWAE